MQHNLEQQWLKQLANNDKQAYETIFKAYFSSVYLSAMRITKDESLAKDACQEVFLALWRNRSTLQINTSLKAYLHRGVINRSLNLIKSRNRHAGQDLEGIAEPSITKETPSQLAEANDLNVLIQQTIDNLPDRCRQIFVLSRFEKKTYQEIADLLEISIKTVENQMLKALKLLRQTVEKYESG